MTSLLIRRASAADAPLLADFNCRMALETEHKRLVPERARAGTERLLADPALGFYLVAERAGRVVGSLLVTTEWSDWRNGLFWWVQSVYVEKEFRRQGVYRRMYDHVRELARADPAICGFRLYAEKDNAAAHATYTSLGMKETDYLLWEELKPGVRFLRGQ